MITLQPFVVIDTHRVLPEWPSTVDDKARIDLTHWEPTPLEVKSNLMV